MGERSRLFPVWVVVFTLLNGLMLVGAIGAFLLLRPVGDESDSANAPSTASAPADTLAKATAKESHTEQAVASGDPAASNIKPPTTQDLVADAKHGVVYITTFGSSGEQRAMGTGFVLSDDGLVATNFHVLRGASSAEAEFHDRSKAKFKGVRAWSPSTDLAILELESMPDSVTPLVLSADEERPNASEVISIGHPEQFKFSTSTGIISAVHKTSDLPKQYQQFLNAKADDVWLQTTAAISGGSSGGPLLNEVGEVIGVNTWLSQRYSFAIDARHLAEITRALTDEPRSLADLTGPEEKLMQLLGEFNHKLQWFQVEASRETDLEERRKLIESRHPAPEFASRILDLAQDHHDTPMAFDALRSVCQIAGQPGTPSACDAPLKKAGEMLAQSYLDDPRMEELLWSMRGTPRPGGWLLLEKVASLATNRDLQGIACYCEGVAKLNATEDKAREQANACLNRVKKDFADVIYHCQDPRHPQHAIAAEAEEMLYQMRNLAVGQPAMEIQGPSSDGAPMKLSDYRGKVVVLDFWADWCPPCMQMLPHERKLVEEFKEEPVALLGVFLESQSKVQRLIDSKTVTWRNWVDGRGGPIGQQWRISAIPTFYIIDQHGVIRHKVAGTVPPAQLRKWIRELLASSPASDKNEAGPALAKETPADKVNKADKAEKAEEANPAKPPSDQRGELRGAPRRIFDSSRKEPASFGAFAVHSPRD